MATKANLIIDQGSDFHTEINITDEDDNPIDLSGYTGVSQLRKHYTSSTSTPFVVHVDIYGNIQLVMSASTTANLVAGRYVYDVELVSSGNVVTRVVEGIVTVTPQVTKNANTGI